jgi:hypothetical protein
MLKPRHTPNENIPTAAFMEFSKEIFYDATIPEDKYTPLVNKEDNYISAKELTEVIKHKFKANKSSGLSPMPLQLLKHLGHRGIESMTTFMNKSAIDNPPPQTWRASKIVPLFKNKGNINDPSNYRSLAINPPFAKLFMAVMNNRLTKTANIQDLHAPT